jgi:hypothetical protein
LLKIIRKKQELTQVDHPVAAAQYPGETFVVEFALVLHADLTRDRVGGGVGG